MPESIIQNSKYNEIIGELFIAKRGLRCYRTKATEQYEADYDGVFIGKDGAKATYEITECINNDDLKDLLKKEIRVKVPGEPINFYASRVLEVIRRKNAKGAKADILLAVTHANVLDGSCEPNFDILNLGSRAEKFKAKNTDFLNAAGFKEIWLVNFWLPLEIPNDNQESFLKNVRVDYMLQLK